MASIADIKAMQYLGIIDKKLKPEEVSKNVVDFHNDEYDKSVSMNRESGDRQCINGVLDV